MTALADLVARAGRLADSSARSVLGVAGAPGAGKSTLAAALVEALGGRAVLVPMDGFHLDDTVLDALEKNLWNQTRAAAALGVSRRTLHNWLDELGVPRARGRRSEE